MNTAVIFTGLPRLPELFRRSVEEMYELQKDGLIDEIIFVTWEGRLENQSDLRSYLIDHEVEITENEESPIDGESNIWHQMKALDIGLNLLPDDCYVLKTRSDVHIKKGFLRDLFSGNISYLNQKAGSDVFNKRIWVPWFRIEEPFLIDDRCFFGLKEDLTQLVNYNTKYDVFRYDVRGLPHVRRFINPYLNEYEFLEVRFQYSRPDQEMSDTFGLFKHRVKSTIFGAFLSFYYKTMMEDFYIHMDPVEFHKMGWKGPPRPVHQRPLSYLDKTKFMTNYQSDMGLRIKDDWIDTRQDSIYCYRTEWLLSHLQNKKTPDIPDHIIKGVNRPYDEWNDIEIGNKNIQSDIKKENMYWSETNDSHILSELRNHGLDLLALLKRASR